MKHNETILEGHRLVIDLLSHPTSNELIQHVLVTENALSHPQLGKRLYSLLLNLSCPVSLVSEEIAKFCSDTETTQGVFASASIPPAYCHVETRSGFFLVLDGLSDPGNMGTLFRAAVAVGAKAVLMLPNCVDAYSPKAVRSGMGANFRIPVARFDSVRDCKIFLEGVGVTGVYAANMEEGGESSPYWDVDWASDGNCALFIGREGTGLSQDTRDEISNGNIRSVYVPMEEGSVESLNAAVCGSVVLFEYYRQLKSGQRDASSTL